MRAIRAHIAQELAKLKSSLNATDPIPPKFLWMV